MAADGRTVAGGARGGNAGAGAASATDATTVAESMVRCIGFSDVRVLAELCMALDPELDGMTIPPVDNYDGKGDAINLRSAFEVITMREKYATVLNVFTKLFAGSHRELFQAAVVLYVRYRSGGVEEIPDDELGAAWKDNEQWACMERDVFNIRHRHLIHDVNFMGQAVVVLRADNTITTAYAHVKPSSSDFYSAIRDFALYAGEALRAQVAADLRLPASVSARRTDGTWGTPVTASGTRRMASTHCSAKSLGVDGFISPECAKAVGGPDAATAVRHACDFAAVLDDLVSAQRSIWQLRFRVFLAKWMGRGMGRGVPDDRVRAFGLLVLAGVMNVLVRIYRATSGSDGTGSRRAHGLLPVGNAVADSVKPAYNKIKEWRGAAAHQWGLASCLSFVTRVNGAEAETSLLPCLDGELDVATFVKSANALVDYYIEIATGQRDSYLAEVVRSIDPVDVRRSPSFATTLESKPFTEAAMEKPSTVAAERDAKREMEDAAAVGATAADLFGEDDDDDW